MVARLQHPDSDSDSESNQTITDLGPALPAANPVVGAPVLQAAPAQVQFQELLQGLLQAGTGVPRNPNAKAESIKDVEDLLGPEFTLLQGVKQMPWMQRPPLTSVLAIKQHRGYEFLTVFSDCAGILQLEYLFQIFFLKFKPREIKSGELLFKFRCRQFPV